MKRLASIAVVLAVVATACGGGGGGGGTAGPSGQVKEGGVLRLAAFDGVDSLNPFSASNDDSYSAYEYIYPQLVQYDSQMNLVSDFATDWSHSSDGLTWTFHTQPSAKWSDGEPLTSEDVAWTYNTIIEFKDGSTASAAGSILHLVKVEAPDPTTVVFTYDEPVPAALAQLQQVSILPEHIWGPLATGDGKAIKTYPNTPSKDKPLVCGGPFYVTQYQPDAVTMFVTNPNYYGPAPHIDGFGLQYFSNEDAMVTALKTHQIDAIEMVPSTSVKTLQDAGFKVYTGPALTYRTFIINSSPYKKTNPELMDPQVRQAFEYATDRGKIVDTAWLGYAAPGTTIVPPSTGKWHDSSIQPLPFDIAKANEILDSLGYQKGSDGIRVANGHPMTYEVIFPGSERGAGDRTFQIIQADFAEIGVKLIQKPVTGAYALMTAPDNKYLNWDLAMWNWTPWIDPDFILSAMTCRAMTDEVSDSGYCNPAYDKLYAEQGRTVDQAERLQIVYEMQKMIYDARPYIVLVYNDTIDAWDSNAWAGFVQSPQGMFPYVSKESLTSVHQV
jgi:peptide/nickel transport system substrate-binding protein